MRKVLISRGFGAGWSTWMHDVPTKFACEYEPLIKAVESKDHEKIREAIWEFKKDAEKEYGVKHIYTGGADGLCVVEVPYGEGYRINEYDGAESIELESEIDWN